MSTDDPFGILIFLSLFEVLGGAALGGGLRSVARGNGMGWFFLVWGAGFAGIPLFIGAINFLANEQPIYLYAQLFLLLGAMVTAALLPDDFLQSSSGENSLYAGAITGAVMAMIGGTVLILDVRQGVGIGSLIGGFFAIVGAVTLVGSMLGALRALK